MTAAPYSKPWKSLDEQVDLLKCRGLAFADEQHARDWLQRANYYRLSGYWYLYRQPDPQDVGGKTRISRLQPGTSFDMVTGMYLFDEQLRSLVFDGICTVEVAIRASVGYHLGNRSPNAHRMRKHLDPRFVRSGRHARFLEELDKETKRSREDFVTHIRDDLKQHLPVWAAVDILPFGSLRSLILGLQDAERAKVATDLGLVNSSGDGMGSTLSATLENMRIIRNVCGHHARLWNKTITAPLPRKDLTKVPRLAHLGADRPPKQFTYETFTVLAYLNQEVSHDDAWTQAMKVHLLNMPSHHSLAEIGFPANWQVNDVWGYESS